MTTFAEHPVADTPDGLLARAYLAGDDDAFTALYRLHHPRIVRALLARVHDRGIAEDLAQEAMLRALQYLHRYDTTLPFWPWVKRIAFNLIPAEMARRSAEVPVEEAERTITLPDTTDGVVSRDEVLNCLRRLPKRQSRALVMRYVEDRDANDMAVLFGVNRNALEQLLLRGRDNFRKEHRATNGAIVPVGLAGVAARLRRLVDGVAARVQLAGGATLSVAGDFAVGALTVGGIGLATMGHLPAHAGSNGHGAAAARAATASFAFAYPDGTRGVASFSAVTGGTAATASGAAATTAVAGAFPVTAAASSDTGTGSSGSGDAAAAAAPGAPGTAPQTALYTGSDGWGAEPSPVPGAEAPVAKPNVLFDAPDAPTPSSNVWVDDDSAGGEVETSPGGSTEGSADAEAHKNLFGDGEVINNDHEVIVGGVPIISGSGSLENGGDGGGPLCDLTSACG